MYRRLHHLVVAAAAATTVFAASNTASAATSYSFEQDGIKYSTFNSWYRITGISDNAPETIVFPQSVTYTNEEGVTETRKVYGFANFTAPITAPVKKFVFEVELDNSTMPANLFKGNTTLTEVVLNGKFTSVPQSTFEGCTSLTKVTFGANTGVTSFDSSAFKGCSSLTSIDLPSTLTTLKGESLSGTSITTLTVPANVTYFGNPATPVKNCNELTTITFSGNKVTTFGSPQNCPKLESLTIPATVTTFSTPIDCPLLTSITIPASVTGNIGAFTGCTGLEEIICESGCMAKYTVTNTFKGLKNLKKVVLPDGQTTLTQGMFLDCTALEDIDISMIETVTTTGAFSGCTSLKTVKLSDNLGQIASRMFQNCTSLQEITLPSNLKTISSYAFLGCSSLKSINIPATVEKIDMQAFSKTDLSEGVVFADNNNLTTIEWGAFSYSNIPEFIYPVNYVFSDKHQTQTSSNFLSCLNLKRVVLPNNSNYTRVPRNICDGCTALEEVVIPQTITSIGINAFNNCSSLKSVELPASLTTIETGAFANSGLMQINLPDGVTEVAKNAFQYCSPAEINLNEGLITIGDNAFTGSTNGSSTLTSLTIPSTVTSIGTSAFAYYNALQNLTFLAPEENADETVTAASRAGAQLTIGQYAFSTTNKRRSLENVTSEWAVPPTIANVNAFGNYDYENATLHVPEGSEDLYAAEDATGWTKFTKREVVTGIESIEADTTGADNNNIYDLNGRRVTNTIPGTIYIRDGHKFIAR